MTARHVQRIPSGLKECFESVGLKEYFNSDSFLVLRC